MPAAAKTKQQNSPVEETQDKPKVSRGRRTIYGKKLISTTITLTEGQKEKLQYLGGSAWVRQMIDEAPMLD